MTQDKYCSLVSQELGGTITWAGVFGTGVVLLGYNRPWEAKATAENDLPAPVLEWLDGWVTAVPDGLLAS